MKLLSLGAVVIGSAMIVSCSQGKKTEDGVADPMDYTLTVTNIENADSTMAYLYDYDALAGSREFIPEARIDSAVVLESKAVFKVKGSTAPTVLIALSDGLLGLTFPEEGDNTYDCSTNNGSGELIKKYATMRDSIGAVTSEAEAALAEMAPEARESFIDSVRTIINQIQTDVMDGNLDNNLGYYMVASLASDMNIAQLDSILAKSPRLAKSKQIQLVQDDLKKVAATSAGSHYVDFTVDNDSVKVSLSEYVKPGQYTLVDFWASWCGPCKRAIASLKENYDALHAKGLNVVGVAVWEDVAATRAWLESNPLPWPIILDAQSGPTDLYGIKGIPTMILIDPEGVILCRSYNDEEVIEAFEKAISE